MHKPYKDFAHLKSEEESKDFGDTRFEIMTTDGLDSAIVTLPTDLMLDVVRVFNRLAGPHEEELFYDFVNYLYHADCAATAPANHDEWKTI